MAHSPWAQGESVPVPSTPAGLYVGLVVTEGLLDDGGDVVVPTTNDTGVQHAGLGVKWVDSG